MSHKTIYAIYDTQEKCFVSYNHKAAWTTVGNAKNAYGVKNYWGPNAHKFDEQNRYKLHKIDAPIEVSTENLDPCPGCRPGVVCRTPLCGRLKAKGQA